MIYPIWNSGRNTTRAAVAILLLLPVLCFASDSRKPDELKKPDAGTFVLTIQGSRAGTSSFKFDGDGGSEADGAVTTMGRTQKFKVSVKAKAGKVIGVGSDAGPSNHFAADIEGTSAKLRVNDGQPESVGIPAGALPFGNITPHLLHYALAAYDAKKGGEQIFQLLLIEALPNGQFISFPGKLTAKATRQVIIAGKPVSVTPYSLLIAAGGTEIEMRLFADSDRHVLAWSVPSQEYAAVREGYEAVLRPPGK